MRRCFIFLILVGFISACDGSPVKKTNQNPEPVETKQQVAKETMPIKEVEKPDVPAFKPFYVYSDKGARTNHFVPSGFMPDGKCVSFNSAWQQDCHSGKSCIKVVYDLECSKENQEWAGVYWLNPANNWGRRKGGFNLTGAQKLTFWAKGEVGGEQIQEFTIGGIEGDYPDTDKIVIGPVILSDKWKQYTIDLRGKDLSYISGGFAWTTEAAVNYESCVFYIDEIRYE